MNLNNRKLETKPAFTIIELLTVMSIIVILFGLLVPAVNLVRRYGKDVKQQAQFHAIEAGLQMFHDDFGAYPDSTDGITEGSYQNYPGAMKLAEAMAGQDMLGFNPNSTFDKDGKDPNQNPNGLYPPSATFDPSKNADDLTNLRSRKGPYVQVDRANLNSVTDYTGWGAITPMLGNTNTANRRLVIADEYARVINAATGKRIGMPVLYYRANVSGFDHDYANVSSADKAGNNIYSSVDNQEIVDLALPWDATKYHPMSLKATGTGDPKAAQFYTETMNPKFADVIGTGKGVGAVTIKYKRPCNPDSFILISAGFDGLYGTRDDMFNFAKE